MIREENQQLRNDVTYFRHRDEVLSKFCMDHILFNQCSYASVDEAHKRKLVALLGPQYQLREQHGYATAGVLASPSTSGQSSAGRPHPRQSQAETTATTTSGSSHSQFCRQDQSQSPFITLPTSPTSPAAQAVLEAEKNVNAIRELKELPVHEISSLCATDVDFSPPGLSPNSLFSTMLSSSSSGLTVSPPSSSPCFVNDFTPSTSYSSTNASSFYSSNEDTFATPSPNPGIQASEPFIGKSVSPEGLSQDMTAEYIPRTISKCEVLEGSRSKSVTSPSPDQRGYSLQNDGDTSSYVLSPSDATEEQDAFPAAVNSSVIINRAILDGYINLDFLLSCISEEQSVSITGSCKGETKSETTPISPLTPLSPPSPNVTLSPLSPSAHSTETNHKDCTTMLFQLSAAEVLSNSASVTPIQATAERPVVRRASSTTSVPSPYFNHHLSSTLSPPPSVPSPTNHGVPESPSILARFSACEESSYLPHFSPVSATTSKGHTYISHFDVSEDEFN